MGPQTNRMKWACQLSYKLPWSHFLFRCHRFTARAADTTCPRSLPFATRVFTSAKELARSGLLTANRWAVMRAGSTAACRRCLLTISVDVFNCGSRTAWMPDHGISRAFHEKVLP